MSNDSHAKIPNKDWLAIVRTRLANERTFLAYFRTSIVFLASGISVLKIDLFEEIKPLGLFLLMISPVILIVGIIRLLRVKKAIRMAYNLKDEKE